MKKISGLLLIFAVFLLIGCEPEEIENIDTIDPIDFSEVYPNTGVYYEIFVRSFADSDGDGIGDFNGITAKLDYLSDLGIKALWLMPIHPSPTYHGYDVTDYYGVNSDYGSMADFERLLDEAEARGINIIIDFVINHSSNQHPWFTEWQNGNTDYAGYYRKIPSSDSRYEDHPGLWHSMGGGMYYAGVFGGSMPDLNWSNPLVQDEMIHIAEYWLEKGVDGFRLDAAIHLEAEGEAKPPTIAFESTLTKLEYFEFKVKEAYPDAYIVGEVWDSFNVYSKFYKAMDSAFNFELGDAILNAVNTGYAPDYVATYINHYNQLLETYSDPIDAPFIKNHDQDRIASILNGNLSKLSLAAELLLALPGNPFLYYGEELGMKGEKTYGPSIWDETRRLPLPFGDSYQTSWFVDTYNTDVPSAIEQMNDGSSLYHTYRTMIQARNASLALSYGDIVMYEESNAALLGYYRIFNYDENNQEIALVLHNISDSDYQLYIDEYDVLYYSHGMDTFSNTIAPKSTVILQLPVVEYEAYYED